MLSRTLQSQQPPRAEEKEKPLAAYQHAEWEFSKVIQHGKWTCALQNAPRNLSAVLRLTKNVSSVLDAWGATTPLKGLFLQQPEQSGSSPHYSVRGIASQKMTMALSWPRPSKAGVLYLGQLGDFHLLSTQTDKRMKAPPFLASEPDGMWQSCSFSAYCLFPRNCFTGDQPSCEMWSLGRAVQVCISELRTTCCPLKGEGQFLPTRHIQVLID